MALSYSAPPTELAVELAEVRSDAAAIIGVFNQLNAPLPETFPKAALQELALALRELPEGTAKGCLRPLNEAQALLASVRSQHILHDDDVVVKGDDDRPPLYRGEVLDQNLRNLMSSVSTALQTANRLASEEPELDVPESASLPLNDTSTAKILRHSLQAEKELKEERDGLGAIRSNSEGGDDLRRKLTDALILNWLGRGELRMPRIVSARLRRIGIALQEYPRIIQQSAELISKGTDVADYGFDKWHQLKERIFKAGTSTLRELANDLIVYAKRMDTRVAVAQPSKPPVDFDIHVATHMIHGGNAPPLEWRPYIESLPLGNRRLKNVAALDGLTNLLNLDHLSTRLQDISSLRTLTSLQYLNLSFTRVVDLEPLSGATAVKHLYLDGVPTKDFSSIRALKNLEYFSADHTEFSDVSVISSCARLKYLSLAYVSTSIIPAGSLPPDLETLNLDGAKVLNADGIGGLKKLKILSLDNVAVKNFDFLLDLPSLEKLSLGGVRDRRRNFVRAKRFG